MNSKAIKRQLLAAIAMVLVAAIALGSSTYAWFSANKTVTASGVELSAQVPTQLLIKGSAEGAQYKSAIDFSAAADSANSATAKSLINLPAAAYKTQSTAGTANRIDAAPNWKKLTSAGQVKVDIAGRVDGKDADFNATDYVAAIANTDYYKDTFSLKLVGEPGNNEAGKKVTAKITAKMTGSDLAAEDGKTHVSPIYKAIHIAFSDGTTLYEQDLGNGTVAYATDGNSATVTLSNVTLTAMDKNDQEVNYTMYIWYDGEDEDCKNSNAATINTFSYSFDFTYGTEA